MSSDCKLLIRRVVTTLCNATELGRLRVISRSDAVPLAGRRLLGMARPRLTLKMTLMCVAVVVILAALAALLMTGAVVSGITLVSMLFSPPLLMKTLPGYPSMTLPLSGLL